MKYKIVILLIVVIILTLSIDRAVMKYAEKPCASTDMNTPVKSPCVTDNANGRIEDDKITYTTFSSPKADFTFEYPSTWVYEEQNLQNLNATGWNFYVSIEKKSEIPVFAVVSPLTESVNFCSDVYSDEINSYQLITFPTNDSKTFVTYERCGGKGYGSIDIYWQKGKYFRNANDIKDILKINSMKFYSNSEKEMEISKHVAESIKIK